jgi:hypothetical protein
MKVKDKSSKNNILINGKEVATITRTTTYLKKIITAVPEEIKTGWNKKNISTVISILLDSQNHAYIRKEGFSLLLLWLNALLDRDFSMNILNEYKAIDELDKLAVGGISLYANAINLAMFEPFSPPLPALDASAQIGCELDGEIVVTPWVSQGRTFAKQAQISGGFFVDHSGVKIMGIIQYTLKTRKQSSCSISDA